MPNIRPLRVMALPLGFLYRLDDRTDGFLYRFNHGLDPLSDWFERHLPGSVFDRTRDRSGGLFDLLLCRLRDRFDRIDYRLRRLVHSTREGFGAPGCRIDRLINRPPCRPCRIVNRADHRSGRLLPDRGHPLLDGSGLLLKRRLLSDG